MDKIDCNVIRDLLPLYEDNEASPETQELVRKHLADCPDCRRELRMMRTPISMPPADDEEAVKRFLEHRAEVRRKQNITIACVASVLVVLTVFCLCYTLIPRSWDSVSRGVDPDRIMGNYIVFTVKDGIAGADIWTLDEEHQTDAASVGAIMEVLRTSSYRADLRDLLNYTPLAQLVQDRGMEGSMGTVTLYLVRDNELEATIALYRTDDHRADIWIAGAHNDSFYYRANDDVYCAVSALMERYGEKR